MRTALSRLVPLLCLSLLAQDVPTFRSDVALVRLDVHVTAKGRSVIGLTQQDFVLYDENEPRDIRYFGTDPQPLSLVLLLDISGSMRRYVEEMARTARSALDVLRRDDEVAVMIFSRTAAVHEEFHQDPRITMRALQTAMMNEDLGAGTEINPAITDAVKLLRERGPAERSRAIVILTDNMAMHYQAPDEPVIRALQESGTTLAALVVGKGDAYRLRAGANPDYTPADVYRLARESGGEALKAEKVGQAFPQLMETIRRRYNLGFAAPVDAIKGRYRRLRVELSPEARRRHPDAVVKTRTGYIVG